MEFSDWSVIAEIVSALGIIVTLIFLAVQVNQNTRQSKSQSIQALRDDFLENLDLATRTRENAEIFCKGLNGFDNLPRIDKAIFHSLLHTLVHGYHSIWEASKAGLINEQDLAAIRNHFISYLMTPGGSQWWSAFKHALPPYFASHLEEEIHKAEGLIIPATDALPWFQKDV